MARTMVLLVGDDRDQCEKLKTMSQGMGCTVHVFTPNEWGKALHDPSTRQKLMGEVPALSAGMSPLSEGAKILQFPQPSMVGEEGGNTALIDVMADVGKVAEDVRVDLAADRGPPLAERVILRKIFTRLPINGRIEKGETFQVARFRMVNAQFDAPADTFQILIFTRKGELLINTMYEAK